MIMTGGESSSTKPWPGDTSEPKTAETKGQGIKQGPDYFGRGEESFSSIPQPGDTREPKTAETKGTFVSYTALALFLLS